MIKKRVWEILELSEDNDKPSKYFDYFISILIGLNVVAIVLETEKSLYETPRKTRTWLLSFFLPS